MVPSRKLWPKLHLEYRFEFEFEEGWICGNNPNNPQLLKSTSISVVNEKIASGNLVWRGTFEKSKKFSIGKCGDRKIFEKSSDEGN
jgi:hypothetical protein